MQSAARSTGRRYPLLVASVSRPAVSRTSRASKRSYSGATLLRPAVQRPMDDIRAGLVDIVVVYKIDRLTRSLFDFAELVKVFDEYGTTFVPVTQQINTTDAMGRMVLNMLLAFAQFERELTGERIRDKFAASKKKGLWMHGICPLGYDVVKPYPAIESDRFLHRLFHYPAALACLSGLYRGHAHNSCHHRTQGRH
jgi:DNA invertase Pin-like site-specific DNA recombinase